MMVPELVPSVFGCDLLSGLEVFVELHATLQMEPMMPPRMYLSAMFSEGIRGHL